MFLRRAAAVAATWLLCGSFAAPSFAVEGTSGVQLDYEAPQSCPNVEAFASALEARGIRVELTPELPMVRVRIRAGAEGFLGTLTISAASGPWLARDVQAKDCGEIASAFALVAAVTAAHGSPEPAGPIASDQATTATPPPVASAPPPAPAAPPPPPVATRDSVTSPAERLDLTSALSPSWRFALGAGALVQRGVLPHLGAGILVFGERVWRPSSTFSPLVRLGLAWSRQEFTRIGSARFDWLLLRTAVCPWQWPASGNLRLRPCAAVETGILRGQGIGGSEVLAATASTGWWLAPGIGLRVQAAWDWLALGAAMGGFAPLFRDRFYFGPDVTLHRPELVTLSTEITLGVRFR